MRVLGISGPSGAGKSTVAERLRAHLEDAEVLSMDSYYDTDDETADDANFCDLRYIRVEAFVADAKALACGEAIVQRELDRRTFLPTGRLIEKRPATWLVLEGMVIFRIAEIVDLCDIHIYLAPDWLAIRERKLLRDGTERGRPLETTEAQLRWVHSEYERDLAELDDRIAFVDASGPLVDVWAAVSSFVDDGAASRLPARTTPRCRRDPGGPELVQQRSDYRRKS